MYDQAEILPAARLQTMQIIAGALLMGVVSFLGVTLFVVWGQNEGHGKAPPGDLPVLSLMSIVMFVTCAPLAFIVPSFILRSAVRPQGTDTQQTSRGEPATNLAGASAKFLGIWQTALIVGLALLEGSAFMGCVAYLIEAQFYSLAVVGAAILLMLCKFPTRSRVITWLQQQLDRLEDRKNDL